jgi:uncharacterized protein HemX
MDVNLLRKICGEMPIDHLPAAQIVKAKKQKIILMLALSATLLGVGVWCGVKWQKRKQNDFKLPESNKKETTALPKKSNEDKAPVAPAARKGRSAP